MQKFGVALNGPLQGKKLKVDNMSRPFKFGQDTYQQAHIKLHPQNNTGQKKILHGADGKPIPYTLIVFVIEGSLEEVAQKLYQDKKSAEWMLFNVAVSDYFGGDL